jgi:hypothetical protein
MASSSTYPQSLTALCHNPLNALLGGGFSGLTGMGVGGELHRKLAHFAIKC